MRASAWSPVVYLNFLGKTQLMTIFLSTAFAIEKLAVWNKTNFSVRLSKYFLKAFPSDQESNPWATHWFLFGSNLQTQIWLNWIMQYNMKHEILALLDWTWIIRRLVDLKSRSCHILMWTWIDERICQQCPLISSNTSITLWWPHVIYRGLTDDNEHVNVWFPSNSRESEPDSSPLTDFSG